MTTQKKKPTTQMIPWITSKNIDISEYVSDGDDDVADYRTRDDNYPEMDEQKPCHKGGNLFFHESLLDQLGMLSLDEKTLKIARTDSGKPR